MQTLAGEGWHIAEEVRISRFSQLRDSTITNEIAFQQQRVGIVCEKHLALPGALKPARSQALLTSAKPGGGGAAPSLSALRALALDSDLAKARIFCISLSMTLIDSRSPLGAHCSLHFPATPTTTDSRSQVGKAILPKRLTAGRLPAPLVLQARARIRRGSSNTA